MRPPLLNLRLRGQRGTSEKVSTIVESMPTPFVTVHRWLQVEQSSRGGVQPHCSLWALCSAILLAGIGRRFAKTNAAHRWASSPVPIIQ